MRWRKRHGGVARIVLQGMPGSDGRRGEGRIGKVDDAGRERLDEALDAAPVRVDPTGVPNLDLVLGGGVPRGALVLIVGPPGSGKTTLTNQMAFAAARAGRHALILTALSEPTNKLVANLRSFSFFEENLLGDAIRVLSLQQFLPRGLEATADEIVALARRARATFVMLDGFRGIRGADSNPQAAREFLYDVGTALSVQGATTVITSEAQPRDASLFPEATTADVLVGAHYSLDGVRQRRAIEAIKVRGAAPLPGLHGLTLTGDGAVVYPRLEARVVASAQPVAAGQPRDGTRGSEEGGEEGGTGGRLSFGLPELDALLGGGFTRETSTLLMGSLGTGKTLLALHLAAAALAAGEPVVFLGFREDRRQLLLAADAFDPGLRIRQALARGDLTFLRMPPVELDADAVAERLFGALDRTGARVLVVDSVTELERAAMRSGDPGRVDDYLAAMVEALRRRGTTSLFVKETQRILAAQIDVSADAISVIAENVLLLQQVTYRERLHRVLSVLKMRFSAHDTLLREFVIAPPAGIRVLAPLESDADVLSGIARQQGGTTAAGEDTARAESGDDRPTGAGDRGR